MSVMKIGWITLLIAAACEVKESDRPCPCAAGWICCEGQNVCVAEASACGPDAAADGPVFDGQFGTTVPVSLGPQCELRCDGTATVLVEASFEADGLAVWTPGSDPASATLGCDGTSIEGTCDAEVSGSGVAIYQTYAPQAGTVLVRVWVRPAIVPNGGGIYLRTAVGSEDYIAFVLRDGKLAYQTIASGENQDTFLLENPPGEWTCLRAIIDLAGHTTAATNRIGINPGRLLSPNFHGVIDALTTVELAAEGGNTAGWDGLQVIACQ